MMRRVLTVVLVAIGSVQGASERRGGLMSATPLIRLILSPNARAPGQNLQASLNYEPMEALAAKAQRIALRNRWRAMRASRASGGA